MRERRYGAKGERACKPNCKFFCRLDCKYTCKYTYKYLEIFFGKNEGERGRGRGNEGWCGSTCKFSYKSTYKYSYKLTYKYLGFFLEGEELVEGAYGKGSYFSSVFRGLSPRSLSRKSTYNFTCNPTYNPSYCPHTSAIARGGTAVGTFRTAEPWSRKRDGEGQRAQREERLGRSRERL